MINCVYLLSGVKERPTTTVKEALGIICNSLHNLGPVKWLYAFCVANIARTEKQEKCLKQISFNKAWAFLKFLLDLRIIG